MVEMATRHDLVEAARAGDDEAFMGLVHLETPDAFRLTLAILRQPPDAEDALQEAFVRAWRELPRLRDVERWTPWFRRIVVTSAIDTGRRRHARWLVPLGTQEPAPQDDGSTVRANLDEVTRAMSHLDGRDRALVALRFGHDLEMSDVAAALGIPIGTAKSRLHRALARLRKELVSVDGSRGAAAGEATCRIGTAHTEPRL